MNQTIEVRIDKLLDLLSCPGCDNSEFRVIDTGIKCGGCGTLYQTCNEVPIFLSNPHSLKIMSLDHKSHPLPEEVANCLREVEGYALNVGCGATESKLPRCIELEQSLFKNTDVVGDVHHLPFKNEVFDAVVSLNTFEHFHDPFAAAKEIFRVLKPGGKLIIQTAFLVPLHDEPVHYFNTTEYGLRRWFSKFDIESCTVPDRFNPALALEWLSSDILFFVTQALGAEASQKLAETTLDDLRKAWLDETGERYGTLFQLFAKLPQRIQKRFSAGFQLKAQRPLAQQNRAISSDGLSQLEATARRQSIRLEGLQSQLEEKQAELEHLQSQLQDTEAELAKSRSQLQYV